LLELLDAEHSNSLRSLFHAGSTGRHLAGKPLDGEPLRNFVHLGDINRVGRGTGGYTKTSIDNLQHLLIKGNLGVRLSIGCTVGVDRGVDEVVEEGVMRESTIIAAVVTVDVKLLRRALPSTSKFDTTSGGTTGTAAIRGSHLRRE
jgi:hypothetical protein